MTQGLFSSRFSALLGVTLWLLGLLVALMTGMLSGYLLATMVFVGSKVYGRMRTLGERPDNDRLPSD